MRSNREGRFCGMIFSIRARRASNVRKWVVKWVQSRMLSQRKRGGRTYLARQRKKRAYQIFKAILTTFQFRMTLKMKCRSNNKAKRTNLVSSNKACQIAVAKEITNKKKKITILKIL